MRNKLEKIRRLVDKLGNRYGHDDDVVIRLKAELSAMEAVVQAPPTDKRRKLHRPFCFQTAAKQHFYDSKLPSAH